MIEYADDCSAAVNRGSRVPGLGRDYPVTKGCSQAAHRQGLLCGGELRGATVMTRPKPASRVAPKQPDGEPSLFLFRFYEAAVRDLTHPGIC